MDRIDDFDLDDPVITPSADNSVSERVARMEAFQEKKRRVIPVAFGEARETELVTRRDYNPAAYPQGLHEVDRRLEADAFLGLVHYKAQPLAAPTIEDTTSDDPWCQERGYRTRLLRVPVRYEE